MSDPKEQELVTRKGDKFRTKRRVRKRHKNQSYPYLRVNMVYEDGSRREWGDTPRGDESRGLIQLAPETITRLMVRCGRNPGNLFGDIITLPGFFGFEEFRKMRDSGEFPPLSGSLGTPGDDAFMIVDSITYEEY